jgi:hypothetical protein
MLIPFLVASAAVVLSLMMTLYATYLLAANGPDIYLAKLGLSVAAAYAVAKASTFVYGALSRPGMPEAARVHGVVFAMTAVVAVGGLLFTQGHIGVVLTPEQFEGGIYALYLGTWILLGVEGYRLFPSISDKFVRLMSGFFVCTLLLILAIVLPVWAIDLATQNMNAVYASAVAAWAGTLTSAAVRNLNPRDTIMQEASSHGMEAWIKRDVPTIIATAIAFVAFKFFQAWPPIVFSIVVGVIAGLVGLFTGAGTSEA